VQTLMALSDGYLLPGSLWLVMFTIGLGLRFGDFASILSGRRAFILGVLSMLVLVPSVGTLLAVLFAPTPELMVGFILLATTPGGILSNLITDVEHDLRLQPAFHCTLRPLVRFSRNRAD
jgi:BASS family bile acid:Na+ symporter